MNEKEIVDQIRAALTAAGVEIPLGMAVNRVSTGDSKPVFAMDYKARELCHLGCLPRKKRLLVVEKTPHDYEMLAAAEEKRERKRRLRCQNIE